MPFNPEFADLLEKYIGQVEYEGHNYFVLTMKEFNIERTYRTDKYSMLEIFQDIDQINQDNNIKTNYYEKFFCE
tara:strand:+ start:9994 stop:10215 length:222 start_codon:yes stop_codon:yes gene_type:complete